jgi:predicted DNA-binding transcriptional regulator AlpA
VANKEGRTVGTQEAITDRLWSVREVAQYLGVSVATVYGWRSADFEGPPGRLIGKHLRYRPDDVRAWVASLSTHVAS